MPIFVRRIVLYMWNHFTNHCVDFDETRAIDDYLNSTIYWTEKIEILKNPLKLTKLTE